MCASTAAHLIPLGLRDGRQHPQVGRVEATHQRLARHRGIADFDMHRRYHAAVRRDYGGVALRGGRGAASCLRCVECCQCRLVSCLGRIQPGLADELLLEQLLLPLQIGFRLIQRGFCLIYLRHTAGHRFAHSALIDFHQHLSLLDEVAGLEMDFDDPAADLRRYGGLLHGFD